MGIKFKVLYLEENFVPGKMNSLSHSLLLDWKNANIIQSLGAYLSKHWQDLCVIKSETIRGVCDSEMGHLPLPQAQRGQLKAVVEVSS